MNALSFEAVIEAMENQKKRKAELEIAQALSDEKLNAFLDFLQPIFIRAANAYNELRSTLGDIGKYSIIPDGMTPSINWQARTFTLMVRLHDVRGEEPLYDLDTLDYPENAVRWNLDPFIMEEFEKEKVPLNCLGVSFPNHYYSF